MGFFFFALPIPHTTNYILPVYAVDSTPSADIKAKLEDLKKEIASKAAKLKNVVDRSLKDKAYVGTVKAKSPTSLTLATKIGPKIVNINQDSEFESKVKNKKFSQKTLTEEDYLVALGDVDETAVLTAKKIILLPVSKVQSPKTYLWGQVIAISDKLITIKDKNQKTIAGSIPGSTKLNATDFIILTGTTGKNDIFEAKFVYVIPQGGILKPKKIATPSGQVATSSAKPKSSTR